MNRKKRIDKKMLINVLSVIVSIGLLIFFIVTATKIANRNKVDLPEDITDEITSEITLTSSETVSEDDSSSSEADAITSSEADSSVPASKAEANFVNAPEGYFKDALFIGDSRTVGLSEYGGIEGATFFCNTGMSVYNIYKTEADVAGIGKVTFDTLMTSRTFGKIYVMLGINELGYDRDQTIGRFSELINTIKSYQPNAIIFIEGNLHVTASRSASDEIINNASIDDFNEKISALADNKVVYYIDINTVFDDETGNLKSDMTFDDVHILGKYYTEWGNWFATKAIVK